MTTTEKAKKLDLTRKVSVRQYVDTSVFNMGLEQYGLSVFSGENGSGGHKEWLGYTQVGNAKIYLTGLDEQADYIRKIQDDEKREAVIAQVKEMRKHLEGIYGKENIDAKNGDFWNQIFIDVKVPVKDLDLSDGRDLILYSAIKAGGFSEIAPSYEAAKTSNKNYKYYLHEENEVMEIRTELTKLRNRAKIALETIYNDAEHLFLIAKVYLPIAKGYNRKTSIDTLYEDINNQIEGNTLKSNLKEAPKLFLALSALEKTELRYKAIVKEATNQKWIVKDVDNRLTSTLTTASLGKNEADVVEYLKNPMHQEDLLALSEKVEKIWK